MPRAHRHIGAEILEDDVGQPPGWPGARTFRGSGHSHSSIGINTLEQGSDALRGGVRQRDYVDIWRQLLSVDTRECNQIVSQRSADRHAHCWASGPRLGGCKPRGKRA